ncbi:MAG: O-antigen ligase family protein [Oscillospiraceae bacterium]
MDTQNQSPKQPKTIFGTTNKSNFILNMKSDTLQNWIAALLAACIIVPQITGFVVYGVNASPAFMSAGLYFTGFSCILFFLIAMIKGSLSFKKDKILWLVVFMAVWAFASYYGAFIRAGDQTEIINTALAGEIGRYEGLLSLLGYFGIFCLAACVTKEKTIRLVIDTMIAAGVVQALFAIFQHIPGLRFMPNFADLPTVALRDVMLSNGLSESPIVFGSFLTIVFAVALTGAVYEKSVLRARLYGAAAMLFWLVGFFTSSIVPIIGMSAVFIIISAVIFVSKPVSFESGLLKSSVYRYAAAAVAMALIFALIWIFQGIYIRDKAIAYYDAFFRLFIVTNYSYVNTQSLGEIGLEKSLYFIKEYPILGIGPDLMAKYQMFSEELSLCSIDRSYNEIVYVAATRGIPAAAAFVIFLGASVKNSFVKLKASLNDASWQDTAVFAAISAYIVQSFFSFSSILCAPMFWMLCGLAFSKIRDKGARS